MIHYGRQYIDDDDKRAVLDVLASDWLTQGPLISAFEDELTRLTNSNHAVCVNSATSALHIACLALGVGAGDYVWTSANTFVASANCALYCGAEVEFVDIDASTFNMSMDSLENKLSEAEVNGRLPAVVIVVHFSGLPADLERLKELRDRYGFRVIEDASHALGAKYKEVSIGSCNYSDVTVFSFHPVKMITTGEGGAALTNNDSLANKMRFFASHGLTKDEALFSNSNQEEIGPWYYEQQELGYNYRISDIQCALGISQLRKLPIFLRERREISNFYSKQIEENAVEVQIQAGSFDRESSNHLFVIVLKKSVAGKRVFQAFRENGIALQKHYIPVYLQPYYRKLGFEKELCPTAEDYYKRCISLPIYPGLSKENQELVVSTLKSVVRLCA